jgi:hypothetical protein
VQFPNVKSWQQVLLTQSELALHVPPFGHLSAQLGPPQSADVSPWFSFPSKQLTQTPLSQALFAQSVFVLQAWPSAQMPQSSVVPQPSVGWPHCVPQALGVQHWLLKHTVGATQLVVQSSVLPQPSGTAAPHAVAGHAVRGVQHLFW